MEKWSRLTADAVVDPIQQVQMKYQALSEGVSKHAGCLLRVSLDEEFVEWNNAKDVSAVKTMPEGKIDDRSTSCLSLKTLRSTWTI